MNVKLKTLLVFVCLSPFTGFAQTANFSADVVSGCPPLIVQFNDLSTGGATNWTWDFGNGNSSALQNPGAIYNTPGTYTVQLTVNGGSTETKTAYITVHEFPTANFLSDKQQGCSPLEVAFTDNSIAGSGSITNWEWVFGDGNTSNDQNPSNLYENHGDYSVTLTVTNDKGCENVISKPNYISITKYTVEYEADNTQFCAAPATVNFTNKSEGPGSLTYLWNFDDGSTSNDVNPEHTFNNPGDYSVSLKLTSDQCDNEPVYETTISVGSNLSPQFDISRDVVCVNETVLFSAIENSEITQYKWDFGDGNLIVSDNTSRVFLSSGVYDVTLMADYKSGCSGQNTKQITVLDAPVSQFTTSQNCETQITFTNTSLNSDSWVWDFGDGTVSQQENPVHNYAALGTYLVTLTSVNAGCENVLLSSVSVTKQISADFLPNQIASCDNNQQTLGGCAPHNISFEDNSSSTSEIVQWNWDFGDGGTATTRNASHTYLNAGEYTARLTVENSHGCTDIKEVPVIISGQRPTAAFDLNIATACVYEPIQLNDLSTGDVDLWCWDFGDGNTTSTTSPGLIHAYDSVGTFDISLSVSFRGCKSPSVFVIQDAITIVDPKPRFEIIKNCDDPYTVSVINNTQNAHSYVWDFGDGTQSTDFAPTPHTYSTTGNHIISLKAINNDTHCEPEVAQPITIYDVKADFSASNLNICKNSLINFYDNSTDAISWSWNFGNSNPFGNSAQNPQNITYPTPGKYDVRLTVSDPDGCQDVLVKSDYITVANIDGNYGKTTENFCDQLKVDFKDQSVAFPEIDEWLWDFGDGSSSIEQNPSHNYLQEGAYNITLSVSNDEGQCDVIKESYVVFTKPVAAFSTSKNKYCVNEQIFFSNVSSNSINYEWQFGTGEKSTSTSPFYSYSDKGEYSVTLIAADKDGCTNETTKNNYIKIQKPTADFTAQQISAECPPLITTFVDNSSSDVTTWQWAFDSEAFSNNQNPTYTYTVPGIYDVSLVVTDDIGCKDTTTAENLINLGGPYGSYVAGISGCTNSDVPFDAVATNTVKYIWDFGDGEVASVKSASTAHLYNTPGIYYPILVVEDEFGCQVAVQQDVEVNVYGLPEISFDVLPKYPFKDEEVHISHELVDGATWIWDMGDGTTLTGPQPTYFYQNGGLFPIVLTLISKEGCIVTVESNFFVQEDIFMIPNVFTPNLTDNVNKTFEIDGLELGIWNITIYNRWGIKVYEKNNYQGDWDANELPVGVYYYSLVNAYRAEKKYTGFVQVLR